MKQMTLEGIEETNDLDLDFSKKVNSKHLAAKFIIGKFLETKPKSWANEIKIANQILAVHPEVCDLELGFKLKSLAWLLSPRGKEAMNAHLFGIQACKKPKDEYIISDQKFGEDVKIEKKSKTLQEFLN